MRLMFAIAFLGSSAAFHYAGAVQLRAFNATNVGSVEPPPDAGAGHEAYTVALDSCDGRLALEAIAAYKKQSAGREPKVALIIAERLNRMPARITERMKRFAHAMHGADVFVAAEPEDASMVSFLPTPKRVGFFKSDLDIVAFENAHSRGEPVGDYTNVSRVVDDPGGGYGLMQLIRTVEGFRLLLDEEKRQGWKYDVVVKMRTDVVHSDICTKGLHRGCYKKGAWMRTMAAFAMTTVPEENVELGATTNGKLRVYMAHDRVFYGRRAAFAKLIHELNRYIEESLGIKFEYKIACRETASDTCVNIVKIMPQKIKAEVAELSPHRMMSGLPGEETLQTVIDKTSTLESGRAGLIGADLRRYVWDYDSDEIDGTKGVETPDYGFGCVPYPHVKDA